jgi:hypothetical protein
VWKGEKSWKRTNIQATIREVEQPEAYRKTSKCVINRISYGSPKESGLPEFRNNEVVALLLCRLWMNKKVVEGHNKLQCYFIGTANYRIEV